MTETTIRLLFVDDQQIIRQGLRSLLDAKPDWVVMGEAENGQKSYHQHSQPVAVARSHPSCHVCQ